MKNSSSDPECSKYRSSDSTYHGANKMKDTCGMWKTGMRDVLNVHAEEGSDIKNKGKAKEKSGKGDMKEIDGCCEVGSIKAGEGKNNKGNHQRHEVTEDFDDFRSQHRK